MERIDRIFDTGHRYAALGWTLAFACLESYLFIGYLISIALFGLFQAIFMANAGGAWDNAKKVVEVELKQTAGRQQIKRNGFTVEMLSLVSTGTGTMTIDLSHVLPSPADVSLSSNTDMETMGKKMHMTLDMSFKVNSIG